MVETLNDTKSREIIGKLSKRRVVCARCGKTWIELVGLVISQKEGVEDLCLRIGLESENCQICNSRPLECPRCGSKEVYETRFTEKNILSLKNIK